VSRLPGSARRRLLDVAPVIALVGFLWWFGATNATDRFWLLLGIQALWLATAVVGVNLLVGHAGLLSLGHWAFFLYGGFVGAIWTTEAWNLSPWLGFPLALLAGMVLGAALAATASHLRGFHLTVMTLAFALLAAAAAVLFDSAFRGHSGRGVTRPLDTDFWFLDATNPQRSFLGLYVVGAVMLLWSLYVTANLVHSRWGRALHAVRESETAASASGVPSAWIRVVAFALSAGIVSLAGVLAAQTNLQVTVPEGTAIVAQSFRLVIYAFIGGLGTLAGPVVGAFLPTLGLGLELGGESTRARLGAWEMLFFAAVVLVVALWRPTGIVGPVRATLDRRRARREPTPAPGPGVDLTPRHGAPQGARPRTPRSDAALRRERRARRGGPGRAGRDRPRADRPERLREVHARQRRDRDLPAADR
jgi:ABC-type branched-subunit amino acid transport system permease subunit